MVKVVASFIVLLMILIGVDCRPPTRNLISQYEKIFATSNCSDGLLLLNSLKIPSPDKNFNKSFLKPLKLCNNILLMSKNRVTFSLCDEIFSILHTIYCNLSISLDPTFNESWDSNPIDICSDFHNANFINEATSYYISTSLKMENLCHMACTKKDKDLCTVLFFVHKVQNSMIIQLESKTNNLEVTSLTNKSSFSKSTEIYLEKETEPPFATASSTIHKLNPNSHISKPQLETALAISNISNKQDKVISNLSNMKEHHESITTKNQSPALDNKGKNEPKDFNEIANSKVSSNSSNDGDEIIEQKLKEELSEETDNFLNSTYLNNHYQTNDFSDADNKSSIYEKTVNGSTVNVPLLNNIEENKIQVSSSKLGLTNMNSNEHLNSNNEDSKVDVNDANDKELLKINFIIAPSNNTVISPLINFEHNVEDTQPSLNDTKESANEMVHKKLEAEETGTTSVFITRNSANAGPEISVDDESTFYGKLDRPIESGIEAKKSDISILSKFTMDNLPSGSEDIFREPENNHFMFYFILISLCVVICYVVFHNKQKIIALIVEGCQERRRRPHGISYRKLDVN